MSDRTARNWRRSSAAPLSRPGPGGHRGIPGPDRGPSHRAAPHRPLPRHSREPGSAAGPRRRGDRADRRLPGHDRSASEPSAGRDGPRGRRRLPRRRHRPRPGDDLHPQRRARAQRAGAAVPEPRQRRRAAPKPHRQGRDRGDRPATDRPHADLPRAPGRGHPVLPRKPGPVGLDQLPHVETTRLIARRFNERYTSRTAVPRAGRPAHRDPDAGRTGRAEDEQDPRQRHRAAEQPKTKPPR